jgi:heme-degrading monooxygenase HmoA
MPISMINRVQGMSAEAYDQVMTQVAEPLSQSEGFISHAAVETADGMAVTEVWETREQWQSWFDTSVRPHMPADAPEPELVDLHNAFGA